jgi:hypothetical protein
MAIGSVLNPERIVGKQNTNQQLAKKFISGDSFLGTSSIASAANKIVGFQRGTAKPVPSSVDSIVSTISTNITNNITGTLNNTLQSFTSDYKKRVSDVDSAKPTSIISKFLTTYKNVTQFIQFFGNKKFVNGISDNLKSLSKSFTESFEVAKLIRQVIVKIVQQLSNLPKATPGGGGGIDIDVDVPMGGVRKSAPRGLGNMFKGRGKMLALGAGALGVGAVGAGAVNALSNVDEIRAGMFQPGDGGDIISTFGSAIERFIAAINTMVGIGKGSKPPGGGSSGGGGGGGSPGSPGGPGPGGPGPGITPPPTGEISGNQQQIESQMFDYLKQNYGENVAYGMLSNAMRESGYRTNAPEGGFFGMFQLDKNREARFKEWAKSKNLDPMSHQAQLQYGVIEAQQLGTLDRMKAAKTPEDAASLFYNEFERAAYSKPIVGSAYTPDNPHEQKNRIFLQKIKERQSKRVPGTIPGAPPAPVLPSPQQSPLGQGGPDLPDYMLPPEKRDQYRNLATNVSQPVQTAAQSQTNIVPIDLSGTIPQQSQGGGGGVSAPPSTQKNGPSVPLLPSTNTDNFLVLYSRMVYNIVDG